jgi:hypothetical protein
MAEDDRKQVELRIELFLVFRILVLGFWDLDYEI